jgi:hypothetical protein
MAQALYSGLCVNGGATLPLSSSDNSQGHLPIFDCTTLRMSLNSLDTVVDHLWPQQELDFPQEYIKPRVRSLLQEQIHGESPSDTRLALFCFAFSNMEVITLLAKLKKMDDSDYFEIQYRITQVAYVVSHTHSSSIALLKLLLLTAVAHWFLQPTFTIVTLPSWMS